MFFSAARRHSARNVKLVKWDKSGRDGTGWDGTGTEVTVNVSIAICRAAGEGTDGPQAAVCWSTLEQGPIRHADGEKRRVEWRMEMQMLTSDESKESKELNRFGEAVRERESDLLHNE